MRNRLKGRVAVITGASSGIGAATARLFVAEGCKVVLGDIQLDRGQALAAELGSAVFSLCDITKEKDISNLIDLAVSEYGQIDIMFNCAGIIGAVGPIDTTPAPEWSASVDVLLNAVFYGMKHAAKYMKPRRSGTIISMSSIAGLTGGLAPHCYTACKHAVIGLTKNVGAELCHYGIRVNAIAPSPIATEMVAAVRSGGPKNLSQTRKRLAEKSPLLNRPGLAEDVAYAALWLAGEESGYTSGHTLTVDAGITTGSRASRPDFSKHAPMIREAGKSGI